MSLPLYEGSRISATISNILIMSYAKKFHLTQDAFQSLIELIKVHCPEKNNCAPSVFKLKSFFKEVLSDDEFEPIHTKYCGICQGMVPDEKDACVVDGCPGKGDKLISFDYIPIKNQMRRLFQG